VGTRATQFAVGLTLAAAALRFATLDVQSIWLDEGATIALVHRGFSGMLSHLPSSESSPPLYYVLVWAWTKVFGAGPLGFRSFSALAGTLTVPVLYLGGREISPRVGLWAAALATVNPALYYYSQEARCYALLILFSAGALVLWQRALKLSSSRRLALWAGVSILALLTHYFAAFLFVPEAIVLARRVGRRRMVTPTGAVVAVGVALLPLAMRQREGGKKAAWIEAIPLKSRVAQTAKEFVIGVYGPWEIVTAALGAVLVLALLGLLLRRAGALERSAARAIAIVAAVALLIPLAGSATHAVDVFDGRNVIGTCGAILIVFAIGLGCARAGAVGVLLGLGLCALSIAVIVGTDLGPGYQRDDWRGAAHALASAPTSGRAIVVERYGSVPLAVYLPHTHALTTPSVRTRELDVIVLRTKRTGYAPLAPTAPRTPPPGFRLAYARQTSTYAVSRFLAPHANDVTLARARSLSEPQAEVVTQG
jgi:4-amino-4-deoxy-L-arabinose transferase-like glycosyltransferase